MGERAAFWRRTIGATSAVAGIFARRLAAGIGYFTTAQDFQEKVVPWLEWKILGMAMIDLVGWGLVAIAAVLIFWPWLVRGERVVRPSDDGNRASPLIGGSGHVVSVNQSGGVTARTFVNQAPKPKLELLNEQRQQNPDGTYITRILVESSPYPPASLYIEVRAEGIIEMDCLPQRTGISMEGHSGVRSDCAFTTIQNPSGRYILEVKMTTPSPVKVVHEFD